MTEVVVTTGVISRAKLQLNHHHQQTNTQLFTGRMPFLSPNQQCQTVTKTDQTKLEYVRLWSEQQNKCRKARGFR